MKRFLAVQHTYSDFFGALEPQFEARDIGFTYLRPIAGQEVTGTPSQFDALWLLGGAYPANDRAHCPFVEQEFQLLRAFEKAQRPVVGLGFGAHVLAAAHGATLYAQPEHDARFARARGLVADDLLAGAVDGRRVLVMANGHADLPHDAEAVVADETGAWLAFRVGQWSYGLLFRPELKPGMLEDMVMEQGRSVPDNIGALIDTARAEWPALQESTDRVAAALVSALALMDERRKAPVFRIVEKH